MVIATGWAEFPALGTQSHLAVAAPSGFGWDTERTGGNSFQRNSLLCNESPSPLEFRHRVAVPRNRGDARPRHAKTTCRRG